MPLILCFIFWSLLNKVLYKPNILLIHYNLLWVNNNVWITLNCGRFLKKWEYQSTLPAPWETCMQVKKQELELNMEQQTGSKLGKEYVKAIYCHSAYLTYIRVKSESEVAQSCPDSATPWAVAYQALLSMGFSRQEYWSGLPFPFPGDLPNQGIEPESPAL